MLQWTVLSAAVDGQRSADLALSAHARDHVHLEHNADTVIMKPTYKHTKRQTFKQQINITLLGQFYFKIYDYIWVYLFYFFYILYMLLIAFPPYRESLDNIKILKFRLVLFLFWVSLSSFVLIYTVLHLPYLILLLPELIFITVSKTLLNWTEF